MENYWLTIISISISVILSIISYRRIIGARKERVHSANTELEKTLIRRIVLESYQPSLNDISRLVNVKARDYRIRREELLSETQILENLYTRITESDFMTQDQRNLILERLSPIFIKAEKAQEEEIKEIEIPISNKQKNIYGSPSWVIGLLISIISVVIAAAIPFFQNQGEFPTLTIVIAFIGSLAVTVGIWVALRSREPTEEPNERSSFQSAMEFEKDVIHLFNKLKISTSINRSNSGYDFEIKLGEKKVLIEVKSWERLPPITSLKFSLYALINAIQSENANEGILVTKISSKIPKNLDKDNRVRIMSLSEFRNYVSHSQ
ncbi:MAG: hypothetical protein ACYDG5_02565 [Dehalococcoidales bacterium]